MEEFPGSKVQRTLCSNITGQFRCGLKVGGEGWRGGGGGEVSDTNTKQLFLTSNPLRHPELSFSQQHFPSKDILFLLHLPASKNLPKEQTF